MENDKWSEIVEIHNQTKSWFLWVEEKEKGFKTYLQPIKELRDALEHIIRARANALGLDGKAQDQTYQEKNLDKALGHEYRAFFDTADWLATCFREKIAETLTPYESNIIVKVAPEYYQETLPRFEEIAEVIAELRSKKDIATKFMPETAREYQSILDELKETYQMIASKIPSLERLRSEKQEEEEKARREKRHDIFITVIVAVVCAILSGLLTWLLTR